MLLGGQKLLILKLLLERSERFDAVGSEEGLEVGALRGFLAGRLGALLLKTVRERHLGNVIQSDGSGTSGIVEGESTHLFLFR